MTRAIIAANLLVIAQELDDLGLSDEASELDDVISSFHDEKMDGRLQDFADRVDAMPDSGPHRVVTQNGIFLPTDRDVDVEQMASSFDVELPRAYELWDQAGKDMGVFEVLLRDEGNHFNWA